MGAHVWGPAYLRDHLLPHCRLSGWTPDWYAGFPAYVFYMVVPSLLIVLVNVGLHGPAVGVADPRARPASRSPPATMAYSWLAPVRVRRVRRVLARRRRRRARVSGSACPYGVAFKLVTVLGLLSLPVAAYAFGRLADLPFPTPALLALATVPFLFNREPLLNSTGNIIGGNIASTMAGEFAFSISLSLACCTSAS